MVTRNFNDAKLADLLKILGLEYIIQQEGGWNEVKDWNNILAGGDKQKIAMVRLFYHKP